MLPGGRRAMSYCTPQSVRAGDVVAIHLSATTPTVSVEVAPDGLEPEVVWRGADVAAPRLPVPGDAPEASCGWPVAITVPVDRAWRSGVYLVRLVPAGETVAEPPTGFFVVRTATPSPDGILLVLAITTWNAYNDVGGRNFYTGAVVLSFERPLCAGMLAKPAGTGERVATLEPGTGPAAFTQYTAQHGLAMWHGMAGWAAWERCFLHWAEAAGYRVDVASSLDLERDPGLLAPYRLYLSVGHDEYWSAGMRDAVEGFIARGGKRRGVLRPDHISWNEEFEERLKLLQFLSTGQDEPPESRIERGRGPAGRLEQIGQISTTKGLFREPFREGLQNSPIPDVRRVVARSGTTIHRPTIAVA